MKYKNANFLDYASIIGTPKGKILCHQKFGLSNLTWAIGIRVRLRDFRKF